MVTLEDFENAKDKVMMGSERRSMVMSEDEKKLTAYHEAGHAVATLHSPASDPIHKATIIPRGRALGMVMRLPERDQLSMRFDQMKAHLVIATGGRIAEELIFGKDKITNGAASDIQMVTNLSKKMITEWGMSEKLGNLRYNSDSEEVFLGHSVAQSKNLSDSTAKLIDDEVRLLADEADKNCRKILKMMRELLCLRFLTLRHSWFSSSTPPLCHKWSRCGANVSVVTLFTLPILARRLCSVSCLLI